MDLAEVERFYGLSEDNMSVKEKITYCSQVIYRTHVLLNQPGSALSRDARNRTLQLLQRARRELRELVSSGII